MSTESFQEFKLPPRAHVGYLDPSIASEGHAVNEEGEAMGWTPPPTKLIMPDWSVETPKSIRKYFGRTNHPAFPACFYHPQEVVARRGCESLPVTAKREKMGAGLVITVATNAQAQSLGIVWRPTKDEERMRYGKMHVWDWRDDCLWRSEPWPQNLVFDPHGAHQGKEYRAAAPDQHALQAHLVESLLPKLAEIFAAGRTPAAAAPDHVDASEWEAFQEFLAFKKSRLAAEVMAEAAVAEDGVLGAANVLAGQSAAPAGNATDRAIWIKEADDRGIPIDKRWSLERIKKTIEEYTDPVAENDEAAEAEERALQISAGGLSESQAKLR